LVILQSLSYCLSLEAPWVWSCFIINPYQKRDLCS
jgi:hypothetical protein